MTLQKLSDQLLFQMTQNLPIEQKEFIESKWSDILHYACQNMGLTRWGRHLLKKELQQLEASLKKIVAGIEMTGFRLWKPATQDLHLETIFRLFFDDDTLIENVDFTTDEKLAFFWKYDSGIISQFRGRFEKIFSDLYQEMIWTQHDPVVTDMLIGNLIALYPYFDPPACHEIRLLQQINHQWQMVSYRIEHVPLLRDQIHALGLIPLSNKEAYPILIFCGTPYPAAKGFWESLVSDLHPFRSVGESIYLAGKKNIHTWMEGKPHIKAYGISLGGSLCYHLGKEYSKRVTIHAYVPSGIYFSKKGRSEIQGAAYFHDSDLVKAVGYHPTGENFKCYVVLTKAQRNFMLAHALPVGYNPTLVLAIDPIYENKRISRYLMTGLKHFISVVFFFFALPINLFRKVINH